MPKPSTTPAPPAHTPNPAKVAAEAATAVAESTFVPVEVDCGYAPPELNRRFRCYTTEDPGVTTEERNFGPHAMGGPLYLLDRDIQLPDNVYLADQLDKVTCPQPADCGTPPIYLLIHSGGAQAYIDDTGRVLENTGDLSVFDFLFED